jgi:hypothetical protein
VLEWLARLRVWRRPDLLTLDVSDAPDDDELLSSVLAREVRDGYPKWAHFLCMRCGEHIRIPVAGPQGWALTVDWLRRPTLSPSVWQTGSCGAHFFLQRGRIIPCGREGTTK